jgi:hypothetical protein
MTDNSPSPFRAVFCRKIRCPLCRWSLP